MMHGSIHRFGRCPQIPLPRLLTHLRRSVPSVDPPPSRFTVRQTHPQIRQMSADPFQTGSLLSARLCHICGSAPIRTSQIHLRMGPDQAFVFEAPGTEVDQQRLSEARGLEVVQDLSLLDARQPGQRLQFDDQRPEADEVGPMAHVQRNPTIQDREMDLPFVGDAADGQFPFQRLPVNRLGEAVTPTRCGPSWPHPGPSRFACPSGTVWLREKPQVEPDSGARDPVRSGSFRRCRFGIGSGRNRASARIWDPRYRKAAGVPLPGGPSVRCGIFPARLDEVGTR